MEEKTKKNVHRSPNFPIIGLEEAINNIEKIYKADGRAGSLRATALKHLGYKGEHGASLPVLSAMKKFGLIREEGKNIYLTREAEIILISSDMKRRRETIKECALKPDIYEKLWELYAKSGLPSDETLKDKLIFDFKFNEKAVPSFINNFRNTLKFANIESEGELFDEESPLQLNEKIDEFEEEVDIKKPKSTSNAIIKEYLIPRKNDKLALLKLEKPVFNEDIDLIVKWLELLRSTIVDKEDAINE